jgi:iron complex transport system substrate-binding protein
MVSLSPGASEVALEYLSEVPLVGRTASDNFPPNVNRIQIVMNGTKPDIEAILLTNADTVLYDPATTGSGDLEKLKQHNLNVIPIGGDTVEDFEHSLYVAGAATGTETNVSDFVQSEIEGKIAAASVQNSPTVAFLMPGQGSEHMIDGTNSFLGDLLKRVGAKPVGPDSKHFVNLSVEELTKDDPDVIFVAGNPDPVAGDPRLAGLKAVKLKHVYGLNEDIALREGSRVPDLAKAIGECLRAAAKH